MSIYRLQSKQKLPISIEEAWHFFSNPKNLARITPKSMGFKTVSGDDKDIFPGQIIQYTVKPLMGISMNWVTEITHVIDEKYFVDEQRFGPYALWHHKHFFNQIPNGVEMEDIVDYKLPMGILGRMMHPLLVAPKLKEIFDFREKKLIELFGEFKEQ